MEGTSNGSHLDTASYIRSIPAMVAEARRIDERNAANDLSRTRPVELLVEDDRLFVQNVARSAVRMPPFCLAFQKIWKLIPAQDRHDLLAHWRCSSCRAWISHGSGFRDNPPPAGYPYIRVVDDPSSLEPLQGCDYCGLVLNFPASLTHPPQAHLLPWEIASALARAYMWASREQWRLLDEVLDTPFDTWERAQGDEITEEDRDGKWADLAAEYDRQYQVLWEGLMDKWQIVKLAAKENG